MKLRTTVLQNLLAVSGFALAVSAQAQITGFDVDFDGSGTTYSGNFKVANDASSTANTWGSTVGTGGSGGLSVGTAGGGNIYYRPEPAANSTSTFDFANTAAGVTFTSTLDLKWSDTTATALTVANAGFVTTNTSNGALTLADASPLAGSIIRNGSSTVTLRMRNGGAYIPETITFDQSTLTAGDWYRLSFELTKTATADTFDYTVSLYSLGANGTSTPTLFNDGTNDITITGTVLNAGMYGDSDAFFAYDIRDTSGNTGITHVDNFLVSASIPEPSTYALLIGCAALMVVAHRRKIRGA